MLRFNIKFRKNTNSFKAKFNSFQAVMVPPDPYTGDYEVAPKTVDQTIQTKGMYMLSDVVVKAIPKEYGLVTYDQNKSITIT